MNNSIIFGKNDQTGVISIEDNGNGTTDLFIQDVDTGNVSKKTVTNEYWILSDESTDEHCRLLEGNGYYKYLNPFTLRSDFQQAKKHFQKFKDRAWWVNDAKESFMISEGYTYYKGLKQKDVSVLAFDIETTTLEHNKDAKVLIIANTFRNSKGVIERKLFCYDEYKTTKEFLEAWCNWVQEINPAILVGHNIYNYDLPYLDYCASTVNFELTLGREGKAIRFNSWSSKFRKDGSQFIDYYECHIPGREIVDTFFLSIKFDIGRKYESYRLKSIIEQEGLEVAGRQFYDASLIRKNYLIPDEWKKIKAYAEFDADDALALWDLMGPSFFYMTQAVPRSLQRMIVSASGSQINSVMIRSYLQEGLSLPKTTDTIPFEGAISLGKPGIYDNCIRWDIASLYPSIMRQYKVYNKEKDPKGYFLLLTEYFSLERLKNKKLAKETGDKYYDDLQLSQKIFANSLYGFLSAPGLLFNYPAGASFITEQGRNILKVAIKWASGVDYEIWKN